jgi:hypothetical protein
MALSSRMRSRSSMLRILLERAPLVVPFGGHVGVYHGLREGRPDQDLSSNPHQFQFGATFGQQHAESNLERYCTLMSLSKHLLRARKMPEQVVVDVPVAPVLMRETQRRRGWGSEWFK